MNNFVSNRENHAPQLPTAEGLLLGPLGASLAFQEGKRIDALRKKRIGLGITLLVVGGLYWTIRTSHPVGAGFAAVIAALVGLLLSVRDSLMLTQDVKTEINQQIAQSIGWTYATTSRLAPRGGSAAKLLEPAVDFEILPFWDRMQIEDTWTGQIAGNSCVIQDLRLTREVGEDDDKKTVFRGPVVRLEIPTSIGGALLIEKRRRTIGRSRDEKSVNGIGFTRWESGSQVLPAFDNKFEVWAQVPTDAGRLVGQALQNALVEFERSFRNHNVCVLLLPKEIFVTVHSNDRFESAGSKGDQDRERIEATLGDLAQLIQLADVLGQEALDRNVVGGNARASENP